MASGSAEATVKNVIEQISASIEHKALTPCISGAPNKGKAGTAHGYDRDLS